MANTLIVKKGLKTNLPTLSSGEPAFTTDTYEVFVGDGAVNHQVSMWDEYDANTIIAADTDNTPAALTIAENTIIGRAAGGNIDALTKAETMSLLSGGATSAFSLNSQKLTSLATPTTGTDATTKTYVDDLVAHGLTAHEVVLDKDIVDSAAATETLGFRYWIGGTGATDWVGHDYEIAEWSGSVWLFEEVTDGDMAFVDDEGVFYFYDESTTSLKQLNTAMGAHATLHEVGGSDLIDHDQLTNYVADEHIDWKSDQGATDIHDGNIAKTAVTQYSFSYSDLSLPIDDTPVDGVTTEPISSNWAFDHNAATTGIHGAGSETLLHTGSTLNCGAF